MDLSQLKPRHKNKQRKRVGRGIGSGLGKTSTRGHKGTGQRSGRDFYIGFEGGNVPFIRRLPKYGFNHKPKITFQIVNIRDLEERFANNAEVTPHTLKEKGLIKNLDGKIKILADGTLTKKLAVSAHKFSKKAIEIITANKGTTQCLSR